MEVVDSLFKNNTFPDASLEEFALLSGAGSLITVLRYSHILVLRTCFRQCVCLHMSNLPVFRSEFSSNLLFNTTHYSGSIINSAEVVLSDTTFEYNKGDTAIIVANDLFSQNCSFV